MISSPRFLKARAIAFSLIMLTSFVFCALLCVYMYVGWNTLSATAEHPILALMLLIDAGTVILLLILLILPFREWLDAARFLLLGFAHIGVASVFAYWNPKFNCPTSTQDSGGVCRLLNLYILIASWIIPVLLIAYVSGLAYAMVRSSRQPVLPMTERESILPMMRPASDGNSRALSYSPPTRKAWDRGPSEEQRKHISGLSGSADGDSRLSYSLPMWKALNRGSSEEQRKHISGLSGSSKHISSVSGSAGSSEAQQKHRSELSIRTNIVHTSLSRPPPAFLV
ncbi:hypothetical protein K438DRAFT_1806402 [Mycena galopus ATCC 62051]|nr:hypothetical protein K438DRAFT_1806402 [Mycena galopus ATCC 62051]